MSIHVSFFAAYLLTPSQPPPQSSDSAYESDSLPRWQSCLLSATIADRSGIRSAFILPIMS